MSFYYFCRNTSISVEAVEQTIYFDIVRTFGAVGVVSVDVITQSATAVGQSGPDLYLSVFQQVYRLSYYSPYKCNGLNFLIFV